MKNIKSISSYLALIICIFIVINILSERFFVRLDFTQDKQYTLSKATKDILKSLNEPVTISAYFSEDLPPDIAKVRRDFKEILVEYANLSKGKVVFEFINPNKTEEAEQKAMQAGVSPVLVNVREKDQVKQIKAFLGAVIQIGDKTEIIPLIKPGTSMEYALTTGIKKISVSEKPTLAYLQGHGEPTIGALQQAMSSLYVLYNVEPVTLSDSAFNLDKYKTLIIVGPKDSIPQQHFNQLDRFLSQGKRIFMAVNRVEGDFSTAQGKLVNTGIDKWLSGKGIQIESSFIIDVNCASVNVTQQQGNFTFQTPVRFPYIPIISTFEKHPITKGIEGVMLQFASPLRYFGDSTKKFIALAKTSKQSGSQPAPLYFDINKRWDNNDFKLPYQTVAGLLSGKIAGNADSKMVIVSNGNFPVSGEGRSAMQIQPDNVNLFVNSIDWLSDDTGLIELRTKEVTSRPLDQLEDSTKLLLKYVNFLLPIIIVIVFGFLRMQYNSNLRVRRMEEGYV